MFTTHDWEWFRNNLFMRFGEWFMALFYHHEIVWMFMGWNLKEHTQIGDSDSDMNIIIVW